MEFADLQLTDDVEEIDLRIIPEGNVYSAYRKHFEEPHRAVKEDIRSLQSHHELHKEGIQKLKTWHRGTSGVVTIGMIAGAE